MQLRFYDYDLRKSIEEKVQSVCPGRLDPPVGGFRKQRST